MGRISSPFVPPQRGGTHLRFVRKYLSGRTCRSSPKVHSRLRRAQTGPTRSREPAGIIRFRLRSAKREMCPGGSWESPFPTLRAFCASTREEATKEGASRGVELETAEAPRSEAHTRARTGFSINPGVQCWPIKGLANRHLILWDERYRKDTFPLGHHARFSLRSALRYTHFHCQKWDATLCEAKKDPNINIPRLSFRCVIGLLLLGLLTVCPFWIQAQPAQPSEEKQALYQAGLSALQAQEYEKAILVVNRLRQMDPKDEFSYHLAAMTHLARRDFFSVVATVQIAKQNGVETLFLYKYMTQALFFLGDFGTSMQGFRKIEDILMKQMKPEQS